MTPTEEQQAIIEAARTTQDSLLLNALAGAAKTTTLELITRALPVFPILSIAFNKRIAEEMAKRLPGHVKSSTINSVGHGVWRTAIGRQPQLNEKKMFELLKEEINELKGEDRKFARENMAGVLAILRQAKSRGYIPKTKYPQVPRIVEDFYETLDEEPTSLEEYLVEKVLFRSIQSAYDGLIDFDDQIYMPTLFGGTWPRFPLVMVDEAQDLSPLNHRMLEKLVSQRLIAVGDPWQSIYAFRGADAYSMERLREIFSMRSMDLSMSFRCPQAMVRRAWTHVPHMRWAPWAIEGEIEELGEWTAADIPDGAAIICRNNAPLLACALAFLKAGRGVHLVGTDLGPQLIKTLRKFGPESMTQEQVYNAIRNWEAERLRKSRAKGSVSDRADCLRVFAGFGPTLGAAIAYAEHIFAAKGPIQLLSGHKAKGLEWDTVYHLDPWRIPSGYAKSPEEVRQEANVRYVIETRAKKAMYLVNMEGLR